MNLKRLEYFCHLASLGNFTKAAQTAGIAQPALTVAIQKLEQEVGLKLINRADKNSLLTAEGEVLYKLATQLLTQAKQVELELEELKELERGTIRFGVSAMMGSYYFPKILTEFKQKYPNKNTLSGPRYSSAGENATQQRTGFSANKGRLRKPAITLQ